MGNALAKKFTFSSLLFFAIPNVVMMIISSIYIIADGMFISRLIGTTAFSAAMIVYPAICLEMAISIMIATGGSAIIAKKMGEGNVEEARSNLSFLLIVEIMIGIAVAVIGNLFLNEIVLFLGASPVQAPLCIEYARIIFIFAPAFFLQMAFQTFFVTAGKPTLGLVITLLAGVTNIVLDYVFMAPMGKGIAGAATATGLGYCLPAVTGILFFISAKNLPLHFVRPKADWNVLLHSCTNGSSEMVTNLANAVTTLLFNYTFMRFYGEDGVAAISIILYLQYIFTALYFGYANGIAPIISYKYGEGDQAQLREIFWNSMLFLMISAVSANILIHFAMSGIVSFFVPAGSRVFDIVMYGVSFYQIAFLIMGLAIFASSLFTAFSDGKTSAIISFSRTFIFVLGAILILPVIFDEAGAWLAVPIAEFFGLLIALYFLMKKRRQFGLR